MSVHDCELPTAAGGAADCVQTETETGAIIDY